jgi:hypothetical protein
MKPCKHLDYSEGQYTDCTIETCAPHFPLIRYWKRGPTWTYYPGAPDKVQFCGQGRGPINGVFQCYNGEMPCYEPEDNKDEAAANRQTAGE